MRPKNKGDIKKNKYTENMKPCEMLTKGQFEMAVFAIIFP